MKTKVYIIGKEKREEAIANAAEVIKDGGIVAFPTETVYGLGADALNSEAVNKIFIAKGRPQDNPLIIHISDMDDVELYAKNIPDIAKKIMNRFWPGPLTILLEKKECIPDVTTAGLNTVGIRMPSNEVAREFIKKCGVAIAAPSANISGRPSPTDVERCIEDLNGRVDCILGGDNSEVGVESTIIDCSVYPLCILRPGGVTLEELREIDESIYVDPAILNKSNGDFKPKAPGMKYRHYAPKAKVIIIKGNLEKTIEKINELMVNYIVEGKKVGLMVTDETIESYKCEYKKSMGTRSDLSTVAHNLFETLRSFDDMNVDVILAESVEEKGIGTAVMNRLKKSAGFDIIDA